MYRNVLGCGLDAGLSRRYRNRNRVQIEKNNAYDGLEESEMGGVETVKPKDTLFGKHRFTTLLVVRCA